MITKYLTVTDLTEQLMFLEDTIITAQLTLSSETSEAQPVSDANLATFLLDLMTFMTLLVTF